MTIVGGEAKLFSFEVHSLDRRGIQRGREVIDNGIQEGLDPLVTKGCSKEWGSP